LQFGYFIFIGLFIRDFCHQGWTTYGFCETASVAMHHL
jgi:hypothetical protein